MVFGPLGVLFGICLEYFWSCFQPWSLTCPIRGGVQGEELGIPTDLFGSKSGNLRKPYGKIRGISMVRTIGFNTEWGPCMSLHITPFPYANVGKHIETISPIHHPGRDFQTTYYKWKKPKMSRYDIPLGFHKHSWLENGPVECWRCISYMGVSKNRGTPKSSILIRFSIANHPFWGTFIFGNTHVKWALSIAMLVYRRVTNSFDKNPVAAAQALLRPVTSGLDAFQVLKIWGVP